MSVDVLPAAVDVHRVALHFVDSLALVYTVMIVAWILVQYFPPSFGTPLYRIREFLYDTVEPYLRIFRRYIPMIGPLDLSPMVGLIAIQLVNRIIQNAFAA
jgi:YggT family protein